MRYVRVVSKSEWIFNPVKLVQVKLESAQQNFLEKRAFISCAGGGSDIISDIRHSLHDILGIMIEIVGMRNDWIFTVLVNFNSALSAISAVYLRREQFWAIDCYPNLPLHI